MDCCWCALVIVTLLYLLFDVNYYLRVILTVGFARLFQKKIKWSDVSSIYGLCTTNDVDIFLRHMNNARYLRELDFARFHFYDRAGILTEMTKRKGNAMQGVANIRYRRPIPIFSAFKINTKLVCWDDKAIYLEQQFITLRDGFVRATALSKQSVVGANVDHIMTAVNGQVTKRPPVPEEIRLWLESVEVTSSKLRKD